MFSTDHPGRMWQVHLKHFDRLGVKGDNRNFMNRLQAVYLVKRQVAKSGFYPLFFHPC